MPTIHLIPISEGVTEKELFQRMQHGWVMAGRQSVQSQQKIVDVSKPMTRVGLEDMDVWILPEPMVPLGVVANALMDAFEAKEDHDAGLVLDNVSHFLLRQGIIPLVMARKESEVEEPGQTDDLPEGPEVEEEHPKEGDDE